MKKALIIGSGIAGIAAALRLKYKGYDVSVFEANAYPGGKIHSLERSGYRFDTGPSLFTLPKLVDELFELYGENPQLHFRYEQKDSVCNYFWEDGTRFKASANTKEFIRTASETFKVRPESIRSYLTKSKEKYDLTSHIFLEKSLHKISTYLSVNTLKSIFQAWKLDINQSLNETNEKAFSDPKLVQLFNRYATYNGSSPYQTPGIMSMIPHLEMHLGTYLPKGGMKQISESLYHFAIQQGITFHFNEKVVSIDTIKQKITGITTEKAHHDADIVVSNADVFTSYKNLLKDKLPPKKILEQERSSSALIFYWGIKKSFPELDLHNILFTNDYQQEFDAIFRQKTIFEDPTIYINITSKQEKQDAPENCENWFVMINTPGNFGQDWNTLIQQARIHIISKINRILNTNVEPLIECEEVLNPLLIESQTSSHRGSLYGASSNSKFAAFLRHPNFTSNIKGLYFCGGSVHPGGGIPLSLLSAKIVSDLVPSST